MRSTRKITDLPIVASLVLAVVLLPLTVYVWGYFALSTPTGYGQMSMRAFHTRFEVEIFQPAASVERFFVGHRVTLFYLKPREATASDLP